MILDSNRSGVDFLDSKHVRGSWRGEEVEEVVRRRSRLVERGEKKEREKEGTGLARVRLLVPLVFRGEEGRDAYFPISLQTAALSRKKGEKRRGE